MECKIESLLQLLPYVYAINDACSLLKVVLTFFSKLKDRKLLEQVTYIEWRLLIEYNTYHT